MASSTAVLVRYDEPDDVAERVAVAGFLAGYTGATRVNYTTDLRLFAEWCANQGVRLLDVKRAHIELFARHLEATGRMRSTVARRLSTLASGFAYLSLVGTALAFVLWFNGIRRLPAAAPPLLGLAAPITGALMGWVILGESLSPVQLTGFAVTIAAIAYGASLEPSTTPSRVPNASHPGRLTSAQPPERRSVRRAA